MSGPSKVKKAKKKEKIKLSFADDEEPESEQPPKRPMTSETATGAEEEQDAPRKKRFVKNPDVDTSFLPDRERENRERIEREELRKEWLAKQEEIKQEVIEITYSYWDGSGHRKTVEVGHSALRARCGGMG